MIKNDVRAAILSAVVINRQPKPAVKGDGHILSVGAGRTCPDDQWRRYLEITTLESVKTLAASVREHGLSTDQRPHKVRLEPHPEFAKYLGTSVCIGEYIASILPVYVGVRVLGVYEDGKGYIDAEFYINNSQHALQVLEAELIVYAEQEERQQMNNKLDNIMKMLGELMANQKTGNGRNGSIAS